MRFGNLTTFPVWLARHKEQTGQPSHSGFLGIQIVAPSSITAWLKIPGWFIPLAAWFIEQLQKMIQLPFDANQLRLSRHYTYCDVAPARQELKLGPPIPLRQAAEDTYRWYLEEGMLG